MEALTKDVAAAAVTGTVVALRDVRKVHGQGHGAVAALDGVSIGLVAGAFPAIMGPCGPGKSTLLFSPTPIAHAVPRQRAAGLSGDLAITSSGPGPPAATLAD